MSQQRNSRFLKHSVLAYSEPLEHVYSSKPYFLPNNNDEQIYHKSTILHYYNPNMAPLVTMSSPWIAEPTSVYLYSFGERECK